MRKTMAQILKLGAMLLILILFSYSVAYADVVTTTETMGDLIIRRTAPETAHIGQKIWIVVEIENTGTQESAISFIEKLGDADFDWSQAKSIEIYDPGLAGLPTVEVSERPKLWYYEWKLNLPPNENATLAYWLIPTTAGTYVISPASITIDGEVHYAKSRDIIIKCKADEQCDIQAGENYLTCPEDCVTGSADGICDGAGDGRIDPDCEEGYDPDAIVAVPAETPTHTPSPLPAAMPTSIPEAPAEYLLPYLLIFIAVLAIAFIAMLVLIFMRRSKRE
jgi:hypothetical protein